jgi:hypothetical protein
MVARGASATEGGGVKDWNKTETLVLLALLMGIALGTVSGYTIALEHYDFQVDNYE